MIANVNLRIYILVVSLLFVSNLWAQPKNYITHYGAEDGLPQNTVMDILQDEKGMIWLSTWDGLAKFDGYKFTAYKNMQDNPYPMRSNRIDYILEDRGGYIWTLSYDNEAHRFDPRTGTFMGIRSLSEYKDFLFFNDRIEVAPSGKVWLISNSQGCVAVVGDDFDIHLYTTENGRVGSDSINFVFEDKDLNSWILTQKGFSIFDKEDNKILIADKQDLSQLAFYTAAEINNEIWLGSSNGKIWIYNKKTKLLRLFQINIDAPINEIKLLDETNILITTDNPYFNIYNTRTDIGETFDVRVGLAEKNERIVKTYIDHSKRIWIELERLGASMFNLETKKIKHYSRRAESPLVKVTAPNFFILEDKLGNVWLHPKGGGFSLYDAKEDKLIPFHNEPNSADWKFSGMLHTAFFDKQNNLWISTHSHGLDKVVFSDDVFRPMSIDQNPKDLMSNLTRCVFEDSNQQLWISTKDGKVHVYDASQKHMGYLCADGTIGYRQPLAGITYCMMQDADDNIWLGTKGDGIYKLSKSSAPNRYAIKHYTHNNNDAYSLNNNNIYSIFQDSKKQIWIGTYGGGINLMLNDKRFIHANNELLKYPIASASQVRIISEDNYGNICVGTTLGLIMFPNSVEDYADASFQHYIKQAGSILSLTANDVFDILTAKNGETYIATFGGGVNKVSAVDGKGLPLSFSTINTSNGLSSNITLQIAEDFEGKLWIASEGNISVLDTKSGEIKTYSEIYKIIKGHSFSEGTKYVSQTGMIHFGYSNGLLIINPHLIKNNTFKPYLALTKLQLANKEVNYSKVSPLRVSIDDTKTLKLNHKQTSFNIEFAAIDYTDTKQIQYAYMLENFDQDWITAQDQRVATYNNLSPGEYIFKVKSTNSDGQWVENTRALPIEIVPSFWQTGWARLLYFILTIAVLTLIYWSLFIYYRLKDKMNLEQGEIEMKTRFFMDISHEIRTPLTMIVSPIQNLIEGEHSDNERQSQLQLILKNANRMLRMVNQILDFRKIEKSKLNIQNTLLAPFIEDICKNFSKNAEIQGINLEVNNKLPDIKLWIDRDNIEKLLYNLLSNTFKYTPNDKKIEVNIYSKNSNVVLEVKDEGQGMTKDIKNKLFTRFASFSSDKSKPSTGIGLSIVKEIADKHKAKIEVSSEEQEGSIFAIFFQTGFEHFDENEIELGSDDEQHSSDEHIDKIEEDESQNQMLATASHELENTILIVEDDPDLRAYIASLLVNHYNVLLAADGEEGYRVAVEHSPDFIVSDIMMPKIDGVELLQKIKNNANTSHIPFILLTAKVDMDSRLQGLKYGADDYLTKPFSVKFLKARIQNILDQRRLLYQLYLDKPTQKEILTTNSQQTISDEDKKFIIDVRQTVVENIDNSEFVVEDLASEMLMSRTVFFKKMKALTGLAPIEFIREIKIRYAAKMIVEKDFTIKEISFMIGIADTKYFTRWFKTIMGVTPSEYRERNKPS